MTTLLTEDDARRLTKPYHPLWVAAWRDAEKALGALRENQPGTFLALSSLTKVNFLRDVAVRQVQSKRPAVSGSRALGTWTQVIPGAILRFKELDPRLGRYNHVSDRQDLLEHHQYEEDVHEQLVLDGSVPEPTLLTCGWQPTGDGVSISRILIVCHWGNAPLYYFDLESGAGAAILTLPGVSEPPKSTIVPRRPKEERKPESQ